MPPEALGRPERGHGRRRHRPRHRRRVPASPVRRRPPAAQPGRRPSARSSGASELSAFEGYYANPEATAERGRDGWYWTGDLGYRDDDGTFYFAGRTADWLRVDGENFAAGPIERILGRFPGVASAVVYGVPDPRTGDQVMAALELDARRRLRRAPRSIAFLAEQPDLGTKWAPRFVRIVDAIPVTATGKVDRKPLRAERWTTDRPGVVAAGPRRAPTGGSPTTTSPTCAGAFADGRPRRDAHVRFAITHPLITHPYHPDLVSGAGVATAGPGRRGGRLPRLRVHRPPRAHRPLAATPAATTPSTRSWRLGFAAAVTDDAAADPEHRGAAVPQPVRRGEGGGHARHALGRSLHARRRGRLPEGRVRRARGRPRRAQRARGRGARRDPGDLDRRRRHRRGPALLGPRHHRPPAAGHPAAPADLDRRQQRHGPPARRRPRRRAGARSPPRPSSPPPPARRRSTPPSSWPRPSTTCAAASTPPAATPRPSTSRSPTRPAATRPATPSTPTPTSRAWPSSPRLGVTWVQVGLPGDSVEHAVEVAQRYGEQVIAASP